MKHGMTLALAASAAALSSSPALAAYNGFYFGLEGGYEANGSRATAILPDQTDGSGPAYGLFMGYAFELSKHWFAGLEGSASLSNAGFRLIDIDEAGAPADGQGVRVSTRQSVALSAQLGYMVTDRLGLYGRLGLPGARISYKDLATGSAIGGRSSYFSSYQAGGGLQYALGKHLFTRLEYTYSDLKIGPLDGRHRVMVGIGLGY
jgi:outer membrane immunogenic protein